jgi:glycine cleavage system H lipoate-binding protein
MVAVLVVVTVLALISLDYFWLRHRRARQATGSRVKLRPLMESVSRLPEGVFLQPTYTWSRLEENGEVLLGVHPLLFGLVGPPYRIDVRAEGDRVESRDELARIRRGDRRLIVRSPLSGRITQVNPALAGEAEWAGFDNGTSRWLYRLAPDRVADEVPRWMVAESAVEWTRAQYARLREYLFGVQHAGELGLAMTDGGDMPVGILTSLDAAAWDGVQKDFLDQ